MSHSTVYVAERRSKALTIGIAKDLEVEAFVRVEDDPPINFLYVETLDTHAEAINRQLQLQSLTDVELMVLVKENNPKLVNLVRARTSMGGDEPPPSSIGVPSPIIPTSPRSGIARKEIPGSGSE
ncbi:MAG TPA: hypothetical protein VJ835_03215 [Fimbriimonadaceae bacterium]|nr:hypothetical protein [Fimbriimonadaceae bacterium]